MKAKEQEEIDDQKPKLVKCSFEFSQESHCNSNDEYETLDIEFNSSLGIDNDGDGYFILKTNAWAVESEIELKELFDRIKKVLPSHS